MLLLHEFILPRIQTSLDDFLGVGIADPWQSLELVGGGGVDVEEVSLPDQVFHHLTQCRYP